MFRKMSTKTRRVATEDSESKEQFLLLQVQQKHFIRQKLLECFQGEILPHVRHKIGDAVAEIARQYADDGRRPEQNLGAIAQTWS